MGVEGRDNAMPKKSLKCLVNLKASALCSYRITSSSVLLNAAGAFYFHPGMGDTFLSRHSCFLPNGPDRYLARSLIKYHFL